MDKIKFSGRYNANMINKSWVNITSPHIMTTKILMIRFKKPLSLIHILAAVQVEMLEAVLEMNRRLQVKAIHGGHHHIQIIVAVSL